MHDTLEGYGIIPDFRAEQYAQREVADYQSYFVRYENATLEEYNAYLYKLTTEYDFIEYQRNNLNGHAFATYMRQDAILTVNYTAYDQTVRIMVESTAVTALAPKESNCGTIVTTPQFTQISGDAMFLFRLSDGRFVVYDGGNPGDEVLLYQQMVAQNVLEGKPVVAAWMFSHMHCDHTGGFIEFAPKYGDQIELQRLIVNIPGENVYSAYGATDMSGRLSMKNYGIPKVKQAMETYYKDAQITIPHIGQTMWIGDMKIEIAYSYEQFCPAPITHSNNTSTVYLVTIAGQRYALLGDSETKVGQILVNLYQNSDILKCDFVQIAHHGMNYITNDMYQLIDAKYALWTYPWDQIVDGPNYRGHWNYRIFRFDPASVERHLICTAGSVLNVPLPYIVGSIPNGPNGENIYEYIPGIEKLPLLKQL